MPDIILLDSFDHYDTATSIYKCHQATTIVGTGRTNNGASASVVKVFNRGTTLCTGFAFKSNSLSGDLATFYNAFTANSAKVVAYDDGTVNVVYYTTGYRTEQSGTSVPRLRKDSWQYVEFYANVAYVVGPPASTLLTYQVKCNEESILSGTLPGNVPAELGFTRLTISGLSGPPGYYTYFDDLSVTDGEFLGDIRIYVIRPDGDSTPSEWTPNTAASHYTKVNDIVPDGDTGYLYSITDDQQDMVTLEDIVLTGEIRGIQGNTIAQKDDAGGSVIRTEYVISATPYEVAEDKYLAHLAWKDHIDPMRVNPVTGLNFTVDEINAMTMGVKRIA